MTDACTRELTLFGASPFVTQWPTPDSELLDAARRGDSVAFEQLVAPHRLALRAHCYRMLGSVSDAEDALQESLIAAWRGIEGFEGQSSLRNWLHRVSTNACLRLISQRPARLRSFDYGPARENTADLGDPVLGPVWLEPWLGDAQDDLPGLGTDPATRYLERESMELAFVAALQHLPGTQRAVLILRDVLEYSAEETARMLDTTPQAANSALQRARKTVEARKPAQSEQAELAALGAEGQRQLVQEFISAWERADLGALVNLLTNDVRFTMPPLPAWFDGREAVARFFGERVFETPWRLAPLQLNAQLGLVCYQQNFETGRFALAAINVLSVRSGRVGEIAAFIDPVLVRSFELPDALP
jgi:RNA polymerase sigma-70 factor (TIGR02960 family)